MDVLTVNLPTSIHDFDYVAINGTSIHDLMRFGRRPAKKAAQRDARKRAKQERHIMRVPNSLLGKPAESLVEHYYNRMLRGDETNHDRMLIFICSCGDAGCWNFQATGAIEGDMVIWQFDDELGEFRFDREQYLEALRNARIRPSN